MSSQRPIRLIASDVDGTLLNSQGLISDENLAAIRAAQENGILFAIASGRFPENVYVRMQKYGLSCPIIGTNGCRITDEKLQPIFSSAMAKAAAKEVMDVLFQDGVDFFMFTTHSVCTSDENLPHHSEISNPDAIKALGFTYGHGKSEMMAGLDEPVHKFYICEGRPGTPLWQRLELIPGVALTQSGDNNIEVVPEGVDKASGIAMLAQHYGIPLSQVMTLGDHENDIPMLRAAGYGIAMGNATDNAKKAARFITDTNDRHGLAKAIWQYALEDKSC